MDREHRLPGWHGESHSVGNPLRVHFPRRSKPYLPRIVAHTDLSHVQANADVPPPPSSDDQTETADFERTDVSVEQADAESAESSGVLGGGSAPLKACFLVLTRGDAKGLTSLRRLMKNMDESFVAGSTSTYPLVIFYEGIDEATQKKLAQETKRPLEFASVSFSIPSFITKPAFRWPYPGNSWYGVGYRHMCRFFAVELFKQPVLDKYDWYMRLDTDSYVLEPYTKDPFAYMVAHGKKYGFSILFQQGEGIFLRDLWRTTSEFLAKTRTKPASSMKAFLNDKGQYTGLHFWDNFEIGYLPFFRSAPVQAFIEHIDQSGGIYYHRWGDAELHTLAVALFMPGEELWYSDLGYQHYFYYHCPKRPPFVRARCMESAAGKASGKMEGTRLMEPLEHAEANEQFLKVASTEWGWSKEELQVRR